MQTWTGQERKAEADKSGRLKSKWNSSAESKHQYNWFKNRPAYRAGFPKPMAALWLYIHLSSYTDQSQKRYKFS